MYETNLDSNWLVQKIKECLTQAEISKDDYWRDIMSGIKAPPEEYNLVTDPKTGETTRVEIKQGYK